MEVLLIFITALRIYEMLIFIRILLSWVPAIPEHKVIDWLVKVTDPVLLPAREIYMRIMDKFNVSLPIDLSPILVFLLIGFLERTIVSFY